MVFRHGDDEIVQEPIADARPASCCVCDSPGPFGRALECCLKQENRRHNYVFCRLNKCEAKFVKECLSAAEKGCEVNAARRIKQAAKKGVYSCPICFFELKDVPLPDCDVVEEPPAPPPAPPCQERQELLPSQSLVADTLEQPLDFDDCVVHLKETTPEASPVAGASKKTNKKGKKQAQQLQRELVQALFFQEASGRRVTEEGEILNDEEEAPTQQVPVGSAAPPFRGMPVGAAPSPNTSTAQQRPFSPYLSALTSPALPQAVAQPVHTSTSTSTRSPQLASSQASSAKVDKVEASANSAKVFLSRSALAAGLADPEEAAKATSTSVELPPGWKSAWDPSSNQHYYYHVETKEVTWDDPRDSAACLQEEAIQASSQSSSSTACTQSSVMASAACSQVSTTASSRTRPNAIEYSCVHSWLPRPEDKDCVRLTHGERVVLESETLSGWGIGSVVLGADEPSRRGHFPRWALSDNPAPEPTLFVPGARAKVIAEFTSPASGYLSVHLDEVLVVKYQVEPYIWLWAEDPIDTGRRGWVPESVLRLT